jgi:sialate O-acetylesterase
VGNKIVITVQHPGGGLETFDVKQPKGFAIAGADQKFVWADATVEGETVVVSSGQVPEPVAVRYAWADNPEGCNLFDAAGLPMAPFRTDDWK